MVQYAQDQRERKKQRILIIQEKERLTRESSRSNC